MDGGGNGEKEMGNAVRYNREDERYKSTAMGWDEMKFGRSVLRVLAGFPALKKELHMCPSEHTTVKGDCVAFERYPISLLEKRVKSSSPGGYRIGSRNLVMWKS